MIRLRQFIVVALFLLLAAALQGRAAHAIAVRGAEPDFILVALACGGTLIGGARGTALGFWAGLLTAALIPATFGTYLASRTVAGAFAGWLQGHVNRESLIVPPLAAFSTTALAELIAVLMAPTHHLKSWALARGGEVIYNTLLALPAYLLLRRLRVGREREAAFGGRV